MFDTKDGDPCKKVYEGCPSSGNAPFTCPPNSTYSLSGTIKNGQCDTSVALEQQQLIE